MIHDWDNYSMLGIGGGDTEAVMAYNEDIDLPPTQDISNIFAVVELSSRLSSDSRNINVHGLRRK